MDVADWRRVKGTYDVLIFLCVMSYLWYGDGAANVFFFRAGAAYVDSVSVISGCLWAFVPSYSICSLTSNSVMTFPFRWLTSQSPSRLMIFVILAETSPSLAEMPTRFFSRYSLAHSRTSLFTQCQLLGLCKTILKMLDQSKWVLESAVSRRERKKSSS